MSLVLLGALAPCLGSKRLLALGVALGWGPCSDQELQRVCYSVRGLGCLRAPFTKASPGQLQAWHPQPHSLSAGVTARRGLWQLPLAASTELHSPESSAFTLFFFFFNLLVMLKKRFVLTKLHHRPNQGIDFTVICPLMGSSALKTNLNIIRLFHCSLLLL